MDGRPPGAPAGVYRSMVRTARWTRPAYLGRYYMGTQAVLVQHSAAALVAAHIQDTQATSPDLRAYSRRSGGEDAGEARARLP